MTTASACHICRDNSKQDLGEDTWAIARLATGYVRLNPNQYFAGAAFFLAKSCAREIHHLDRTTRALHLHELAEVIAAVDTAFSPRKLNYEALGNAPHLHWWITPHSRPATSPSSSPTAERPRSTGRSATLCGGGGALANHDHMNLVRAEQRLAF